MRGIENVSIVIVEVVALSSAMRQYIFEFVHLKLVEGFLMFYPTRRA